VVLERELSEGSVDHGLYAKNYERDLSADAAKLFFAEVYDLPGAESAALRSLSGGKASASETSRFSMRRVGDSGFGPAISSSLVITRLSDDRTRRSSHCV
jgi:hypothetical protein